MAKNKQEKFELFLDNGEELISLGFFCYLENMWEFISTYCKDALHFTPHYFFLIRFCVRDSILFDNCKN